VAQGEWHHLGSLSKSPPLSLFFSQIQIRITPIAQVLLLESPSQPLHLSEGWVYLAWQSANSPELRVRC
jgi:hypothetical protein